MRSLPSAKAQSLRFLHTSVCQTTFRPPAWTLVKPWAAPEIVPSRRPCLTRHMTVAATDHTERSPTNQQFAVTETVTNPSNSSISSTAVTHGSTLANFLPVSCPGCGALTQNVSADSAGHYSQSRRAVRDFLRKQKKSLIAKGLAEEQAALSKSAFDAHLFSQVETPIDWTEKTDILESDVPVDPLKESNLPLCDRCHDLLHNHRGQSIAHPSLDSIADSIAESPFKRNHVYHVLDAADFPMSLVPNIFKKIELAKPRSQNRRSQHDFSTRPTVSFIITRSDLLGPTKEMVDSMMIYFQNILRDALGRMGKNMRLGNIHLVSSKRGWWTKQLKDDIWNRGGGNWLMGKVNVGKSNLFEVIFPKGSGDRAPVYAELNKGLQSHDYEEPPLEKLLQETSLLPPPQPETAFPVMPVVSSLPGTTASPIRLPFGKHRGELIDLPGLERGDLEKYIKPEDRLDLIMSHRENVEQHKIRPGQCLELANGLITIVPSFSAGDQSMTYLAYPFVPLEAHVTTVSKAQMHRDKDGRSAKSILEADTIDKVISGGRYSLDTDVTKFNAGSLLRAGVPLESLPFRVYSTDILLEGVGWIELVCQTRRRKKESQVARLDSSADNNDVKSSVHSGPSTGFAPFGASHESLPPTTCEPDQTNDDVDSGFSPFGTTVQSSVQVEEAEVNVSSPYPTVEVYSPKGKHIAQRPPLQAWSRWKSGRRQKDAAKLARPRRPMRNR